VSNNVLLSNSAIEATIAVMARPETDQEKAKSDRYRDIVKSAVLKHGGHQQTAAPDDVLKANALRLYTVTTVASSPRYGGTRTVVVCSSFERAKEIVEKNLGDIYECSYQLAVIEGTIADWLYYPLDEQYWFVWQADEKDSRVGAYYAIERPEAYEGCINFGIG
jgi:hypothetical protein